jgi:hypothetical protein
VPEAMSVSRSSSRVFMVGLGGFQAVVPDPEVEAAHDVDAVGEGVADQADGQ